MKDLSNLKIPLFSTLVKIEIRNHLESNNMRQTIALTRCSVAKVVIRRARLTIARLAAKYAIATKTKKAPLALITRGTIHKELAMTLTIQLITNVQLVQSAFSLALTRRTAALLVRAEWVVAILAPFALTSSHKVLAGTHYFSYAQIFIASRKVGFGAVGMTCARLAHRIIVQLDAAFWALVACEITLTIALARDGVTRLTYGAGFITATLNAVRILVKAGRTHVTSRSAASLLAVALWLTAIVGTARVHGAIDVAFTW